MNHSCTKKKHMITLAGRKQIVTFAIKKNYNAMIQIVKDWAVLFSRVVKFKDLP